jgi:hypothetical protein
MPVSTRANCRSTVSRASRPARRLTTADPGIAHDADAHPDVAAMP